MDLSAFSSYDLGRVLDQLRKHAADFPEAPAASALRSAASRLLPWDQRYSDPWGDPTFQPRYSWLRAALLGEDPDAARVPATDAVRALEALLEQRIALEAEEPL